MKTVIIISIILLILYSASFSGNAAESAESFVKAWDKACLDLPLKDIHIHSANIRDAWKLFMDQSGVRSILVEDSDRSGVRDFTFDAENVTERQFLNKLVGCYHAFTWTFNEDKGELWVHPTRLKLSEILPDLIDVSENLYQVPAYSDILIPLGEIQAMGIEVQPFNIGFSNTFNFPVTVLSGTHVTRDILETCYSACPSITFYLRVVPDNGWYLCPVNLTLPPLIPTGRTINNEGVVKDTFQASPNITPGVMLFWKLMTQTSVYSDDVLINKLGSSSQQEREIAGFFLNYVCTRVNIDDFYKKGSDIQRLWCAAAVSSIFVRCPGTTETDVINLIRRSDMDSIYKISPELWSVSKLDLYKLTKDSDALNAFIGKPLSPDALNDVSREIFTIANSACLSDASRDLMKPALHDLKSHLVISENAFKYHE